MSAGKGDTPRAVNGEVFRRNYDAIFSMEQMNEESITMREALLRDIKDLREMLQSAQKENEEQARLLAMSADREERLRTALRGLIVFTEEDQQFASPAYHKAFLRAREALQ